jgi:hypothetical protein
VRPKAILGGLVAVSVVASLAVAQEAPPAGLQSGPATVAPHWTKNTSYPTSIPEGALFYVVVEGDTLWDLANRFLENPYLWPQIWDTNQYITDAHWIYPGDPIVMPELAVISEAAGEELPLGGPEGVGEEFGEAELGAVAEGGAGAAAALRPVTEETALQCAMYVTRHGEDDSLKIIGSENGMDKVAYSERDIVYLNKGTNAGVRAGDMYTIHHASYPVHHPVSGASLGTKIETTGWLKVILVQEDTASAVVEESCIDIHAADYLKPFERVNVPMVVRRTPSDRMTPPTGRIDRYVIDLQDDATIGGQGQFVIINAGAEDGVAPGNVFTIFRVMYPSVPTPRNAVGEATVVTTQDTTATAKITYSREEIMVGDQVELR